MNRRRPPVRLVLLAALLTLAPATPATAQQAPDPTAAACAQLSPVAAPCVLTGKAAEFAAAACRNAGVPDSQCTLPLARKVTQAARDAYRQSAVHRNAVFQSALGDALPLRQAPWLGTHNSFNRAAESPTISHSDSNQQLSLAGQLDIDVRSLELDLHDLPRPTATAPDAREVILCHGQGPENLHAGCTTEDPFATVLPQVIGWLNAPANRDEVLMLYLEDALEDPAAYASAVATLETQLRRDGRSLIYRPDPAARGAAGCAPMPLDVTRAQIRASGARVILVGNCAAGWGSVVFNWSPSHVESGSTAAYRPFPACDATYGRPVYATKLVRYFEDSTFVATVVDPTRPPADPDALTPEKVAAMTGCGVGLFGFDQLLPDDGRLAASIWSWADGQPKAAAGDCAQQGADARWSTGDCAARRRVACMKDDAWVLAGPAVPFAAAVATCHAEGATFAVPRTSLQNNELRAAAAAGETVWIAHRLPASASRSLRASCRKVAGRAEVRCAVTGADGARVTARLTRGATVVSRGRTVLRARRGTIVLRPRRAASGRYRVVVQAGDQRVVRTVRLR